MNKRIPNGAWCVWNLEHGCSGDGEIVLAQHTDVQDDDLGQFTVKFYDREQLDEDGEQVRVTLRPHSRDPAFTPLVLDDVVASDLRIIAQLVDVLR